MKRFHAFLGSSTFRWTRRLVFYPLALLAAAAIGSQFSTVQLSSTTVAPIAEANPFIVYGKTTAPTQPITRVAQQGSAKVVDVPKQAISIDAPNVSNRTRPGNFSNARSASSQPSFDLGAPPSTFAGRQPAAPSVDSFRIQVSNFAQEFRSTPDAAERERLLKQMLDLLLNEFNASQSAEREKLNAAKKKIELWETVLDKRDTMKREVIESQLFQILNRPDPLEFKFQVDMQFMNPSEPAIDQSQLDAFFNEQSSMLPMPNTETENSGEADGATSIEAPAANPIPVPQESAESGAY
jgi:hypothetical protein